MEEEVRHYATVSSGSGGALLREWREARGVVDRRRRLSGCPEDPEGEGEDSHSLILPLPLPLSLHRDKLFFDLSLVSMKTPPPSASAATTRCRNHQEEKEKEKEEEVVWLPRHPPSSSKEGSLAGSIAESTDSSMGSQERSGPLGEAEAISGRRNVQATVIPVQKPTKSWGYPRSRGHGGVYHTVTGAVSSSSSSTRPYTPSIFEVFRPRSKSDAASKRPGVINSMKSAVQNSLKGPGGGSGGGTGEPESRGPVAKVIHLFRHRSQSAVSAEEKRKARATVLHQQQAAAQSVIRRSSLDKRRLSLGGGARVTDPALDPHHAAILFRDSRGLPVADPFLEKVNISDLEEDENQILVKFFKFHKCYDLIPTSAKLVVFDTQLLVKKAFFALVYNGVRAAPLWDSNKHKFVGMLTITDFIRILQRYYRAGSSCLADHMEEHKLETWRSVLKDEVKELVSIGPDASLYDAIKCLIHNRIHRLPVIDPLTGNVLYILTHKRILRFLFLYMKDLPRPSFMERPLSDLRLGTFDDVATARHDTSIIDALDKFVERRVSALPIVDDDNRLVDIFAKFDVINLAAEKTYDNLDMSLKKANEHRNDWFEGVHKCSMDDTLAAILERIVRAEVHRLVVTDDDDKVIGVLSLSDLLQYLVLRPCGEDTNCASGEVEQSTGLVAQESCEETILEGEEEEEEEMTAPAAGVTPQPWPVAVTPYH